jgi:hypothetical protein
MYTVPVLLYIAALLQLDKEYLDLKRNEARIRNKHILLFYVIVYWMCPCVGISITYELNLVSIMNLRDYGSTSIESGSRPAGTASPSHSKQKSLPSNKCSIKLKSPMATKKVHLVTLLFDEMVIFV